MWLIREVENVESAVKFRLVSPNAEEIVAGVELKTYV